MADEPDIPSDRTTPAELAAIQREVEAAQAAFLAARDAVAPTLIGIYENPQDAAYVLMEQAEEFGAFHAGAIFLSNADAVGPLKAWVRPDVVADAYDALEKQLEAVLEAQERLDMAVREQELLVARYQPDRLPVIMIDGRAFVIDSKRQEVRAVTDEQERYPLVAGPERVMTATEQLRDAIGAERAETLPIQLRDRQR
jgi:hypothetical protein